MNFEKAKNSYRKYAHVQKKMAEKLINLLIEHGGKDFHKIFEIGSGTGFLTDEINKNLKYEEIILNDITENYTNFKPNLFIKGDILNIKAPLECDLILSNAVFQWIEDYKSLFEKINGSLKYGGYLVFSTFGEENFSQIKNITGFGLNYPDLSVFFKDFKIVHIEQELQTLYFKDIKELLEHIKYTGVKVQNRFWTKKDFADFKQKYLEKYSDTLGFELTYHPIYYILKK